jgi:ubiquinone/menaquinone biosynthesis C-methylase UbiE
MDFDAQANAYNERTGFPDEAVDPIVAAICDMAPDLGDAVLMELGAGTGTLGAALAKRAGTYLGMDRSSAMLNQIASSGGQPPGMNRLVGDASTTWPVQSGAVQCFFTSRALHLFDLDNVCSEVQRTADPAGAIFLVGRIERDPESPPAMLRREMRRHLLEAGHQAHDGQRAWQQLETVLCGWSGQRQPPRTAAQWRRYRSPAQMLSAWENKPGLAGLTLPGEAKASILSRVRDWAINRYNDLDKPCETQESYVLQGISFKTSAGKE